MANNIDWQPFAFCDMHFDRDDLYTVDGLLMCLDYAEEYERDPETDDSIARDAMMDAALEEGMV